MFKMNGVLRSSLKLTSGSSFMNVFRQIIKTENAKQRLYSTFWNSWLKPAEHNVGLLTAALWSKSSCLVNRYSTKIESELQEFLEQEINAKTIPSKIDDFEVKWDGSELTFFKKLSKETVEIKVYDFVFELHVDIKRANTTLRFTCSFYDNGPLSDDDQELAGDSRFGFDIDNFALYEGEWKDTNYCASIHDWTLHGLLMELLDEKGVTDEFVRKAGKLTTVYGDSRSYISLLRDLKKFNSL